MIHWTEIQFICDNAPISCIRHTLRIFQSCIFHRREKNQERGRLLNGTYG